MLGEIEMKKNLKLELKCMIASILLIIANMQMMVINTYANDFNEIYQKNNSVDNGQYSEFSDIKNEYEYVSDKVDEEVGVNSSEISNNDLEEHLNNNGIFDDEISDIYGEEDIVEFENMNKEEIDNMSVSVSYYAVEDIDKEQEDMDSMNMIQLTDEEVDMYIAEKYYDQDMGLEDIILEKFEEKEEQKKEKENDSIIEEAMENIGLQPREAYAETQTKQVRSDGTVCMLKKVVTCTKISDNYADIRTVMIWDDMPQNRKLDSIGIFFDNGQYEKDAGGDLNKLEVTHFYTKTVTEGPVGKYVTSTKKVQIDMKETTSKYLKNNEYNARNSGVTIALKLTTDEDKLKDNGDRFIRKITKEGVRCRMYVRLTSLNKKYLGVYQDYIHLTTVYNPIETLIAIVDGAKITAAYRLLSGADINVSYDKSGVNEWFEFFFK